MSTEVLGEGSHLRFLRRDGWEYVQRVGVEFIVAIVAVTGDNEIVLIEQHRKPLDRRVLELPAGLVDPDETPADAAARELLEETGFRSDDWTPLWTMAPSPGLTDEMITFFRASGVHRVAEGGGDGGEDIEVHLVPLDGIVDWIQDRVDAGVALDMKLPAGLAWA